MQTMIYLYLLSLTFGEDSAVAIQSTVSSIHPERGGVKQ